jgi:hypothetical protein
MIRKMLPANTLVVMMLACAAFAGDMASELRTAFGPKGADSIVAALDAARESGIPVVTLENKVREGIAKGKAYRKIIEAVNVRAACIAQVKKNHAGVLPGNYAGQVFLLEKERYGVQDKEPIGRHDHGPVLQIKPEKRRPEDAIARKNALSTAAGPGPETGQDSRIDKDSGKKAKLEPKERWQDENERRMEAQIEKAEKKAEKNERNIERKMEKKERKSR